MKSSSDVMPELYGASLNYLQKLIWWGCGCKWIATKVCYL